MSDINRLHAMEIACSYGCGHRPAKRAVATAATAATPTVTPGGGGDFGRRDRRPVKRASAIAVTAAATDRRVVCRIDSFLPTNHLGIQPAQSRHGLVRSYEL
jgi:hypothetical protein